MKDLVRRIYLLSIATNTCKTYCLTLIKSKLLAGSYDSCFAHLLLRVMPRLNLPAVHRSATTQLRPFTRQDLLLRVCSWVARFIYWLLLNHFFLPVHAGVSLLHTIKSVVFLLDLLAGVCGKRYIKSASSEQMLSCIA